jgi:hypothetical protein
VDQEQEQEEELRMSHQEIAVWIDCQARYGQLQGQVMARSVPG